MLLALHEIFPDAPLYTSVYDKHKAPWAKVFPEIRTSFLQKIPLAKSWHEGFGWIMPFIFESFNFDGYDLVISVTSEAAKGIKTGRQTTHLSYVLTPTRYLWSHYELYFKNPVLKFFSKPVVDYLRSWEKKAAKRPQIMVAISTEVKDRIKKFYRRDVEVIFPPVEIKNRRRKTGKYYLLVSRLDFGYKKVDLAIETFNKLGKPLVIVGTGRQEKKLRNMAKKNIKFAGRVSEKELDKYYQNAKALIMPQEEDFGIVAVEAQMRGVPVVAYKKGGAIDTVIAGKTGIFFEEQNPESLIYAVRKLEEKRFNARALMLNSSKFSKENFRKKLLALINKHFMQ